MPKLNLRLSRSQPVASTSTPLPIPSMEQQAIFSRLQQLQPGRHLRINASAGSGKTTSSLIGADKLAEVGKGVLYLVFGKENQLDIERRAEQFGIKIANRTFHSYGLSLLSREFGTLRVDEHRAKKILNRIYGEDGRFAKIRSGVGKLGGLAKQYGAVLPEELAGLVEHHGLEFDTPEIEEAVIAGVPRFLNNCMDIDLDKSVDFNDQVFLPYAFGLKPRNLVDVCVADETQDLNAVQRYLAVGAGRSLVFIGDPWQACYGFRGADSESMDNIEQELVGAGGEVEELPLSYTRRCGKRIVEEANRRVPEAPLFAFPDAPDGVVASVASSAALHSIGSSAAGASTLVLCRTNAPSLKFGYKLMQAGIPVFLVGGQDVMAGVLDLMSKSTSRYQSGTVRQMLTAASRTTQEAIGRLEGLVEGRGERRIALAREKMQCLVNLAEGCGTVAQIGDKIEAMLEQKEGAVRLSTVHKAKGLESDRVFILNPELMPHPMAREGWEQKQERHLIYVAVTRARRELVYLTSERSK